MIYPDYYYEVDPVPEGMVRLFLGYSSLIRHLFYREAPGKPREDRFPPEIEQWCNDNLSGMPEFVPIYTKKEDENGKMGTYLHYNFDFYSERDATLFKLFWIGG